MKIFQRVQKNLASLGQRPNQSSFNKIQLWIFVKVFLTQFSLVTYIVRVANTTKEYTSSIFTITGFSFINIARVSTLFKNATIFDFIDITGTTLNGSELNSYVVYACTC